MPNERRNKSPWLYRLEAIKSISLAGVAGELNRRRLDELNRKLADPDALSGRERTQYRRLLELVERRGLLTELPSDLRADADGMKRALIALHSLLGNQEWRAISSELLAEEMCCSERTARRRAQDVREASLVIVEERRRPALRGGQAENGIKIVWPTIRDLAEGQGIQALLSLAEDLPRRDQQSMPRSGEAGAGGASRPPGHSGHPPGHSGHPPGHSGHPPGHSGHPPGHCGHAASRRAGAQSPLSFLSKESSPPTPSRPQPGHEEGEEQIFNDPEWKRAVSAVATCLPDGIGDSVKAVTAARRHGWSLHQVLKLADEVRTKRIGTATGDVFAWKPGHVWYQLMHGLPGTVITVQPCEAYRRAKRELDQRGVKAVREHSQHQSLEDLLGAQLDRLDPAELAGLAERRLSPDALRWFRQNGLGRGVRALLLRALQQDLAEQGGVR